MKHITKLILFISLFMAWVSCTKPTPIEPTMYTITGKVINHDFPSSVVKGGVIYAVKNAAGIVNHVLEAKADAQGRFQLAISKEDVAIQKELGSSQLLIPYVENGVCLKEDYFFISNQLKDDPMVHVDVDLLISGALKVRFIDDTTNHNPITAFSELRIFANPASKDCATSIAIPWSRSTEYQSFYFRAREYTDVQFVLTYVNQPSLDIKLHEEPGLRIDGDKQKELTILY